MGKATVERMRGRNGRGQHSSWFEMTRELPPLGRQTERVTCLF
jgi:hypothetical protein